MYNINNECKMFMYNLYIVLNNVETLRKSRHLTTALFLVTARNWWTSLNMHN